MIEQLMKRILLTILSLWIFGISLPASVEKPNVLFICIDDLRPVLGTYGGAAKTPHMDRFAASAIQYNRHYVQFPSCGPSRASMLGGIRPDSINLFGNSGANRIAERPETHPTLPLHFRNNGYTTLSFGKTYHSKGAGPGFGWSEKPWQPPSGWTCYVDFKYSAKDKGKYRPAYEIYDGPDSLHGDHQTASMAIKAIEKHKDEPFFIAVGFYKPHLPFVAPKRFWDLYADEDIDLIAPSAIPEKGVRHSYAWSEIWAYGDQKGKLFSEARPPSEKETKEMIRAYYSAVSFSDDHVGRLLAKLDELGLSENTAVVIWSDHGFHLGDQQRWAKWTQFEADMRSPMLIRLPGKHVSGLKTDALMESVDLYPTLVDYCGLPDPGHLAGTNQIPVISGKVESVKQEAYSMVLPLGGNKEKLVAYSMRTPDFRYIQWRSKDSQELREEELYDLRTSAYETENLAGNPEFKSVLKDLRDSIFAGYPSIATQKRSDTTFLKGGDVSILQTIEDHGGVYKVNGKPVDPIEIFKDHGWNAIRLRLFHTPTGISPRVNDLDYTKALGARIRKAGMQLLLDIHYSDTWADPSDQWKPKVWEDLSFDELEEAVYDYTRDVITEMRAAGAMPSIVQIGNEIGPGMLWDSGRVAGDFNTTEQWKNLARLLQAGIDGARAGAGNEAIKTMIHVQMGGDVQKTRRFFDNLDKESVDYDMIGFSYYPWWHSNGRGLAPLRENLKATINRFEKDVMVVETAYPWKPNNDDPTQIMHKNKLRPLVPGIPAGKQGQVEFLEAILKTVREAPDGQGKGVFYWAPEYIPSPNLRPGREHLSLFDENGNVLPGMDAFREER
jgi:arabinogalactan endo-1,4-beta-galactosidase